MNINIEQQNDWANIGKRVQWIRRSNGLSTLAFAQKLHTSPMNIDLLENASCGSVLNRDLSSLGVEMRWESLLDRMKQLFYPIQGCQNKDCKTIIQCTPNPDCSDCEITVSIPLTLSRSNFMETLSLVLDMPNGRVSKEIVYRTINHFLYYTMIDFFLLYQHEMRKIGQSNIAMETAAMMADKMDLSNKSPVRQY